MNNSTKHGDSQVTTAVDARVSETKVAFEPAAGGMEQSMKRH